MRLKIFLMLGMIVLMTSACSRTKEVRIINTPIEREKLALEKPTGLNLDDVRWIIVTPENVEEVFAELENLNEDVVLFALTDEGYQAISVNHQKVQNYIRQLHDIIDAYKEYYESNDGRPQEGNR